VFDPAALPASFRRAEPSLLQRVPGATAHHEWLLPLMPASWRVRRPLAEADVVVSSSHACAKAVRVAPGIPHVSYCHTPMRYAWDFDAESTRFPAKLRPFAAALMRWFRHWDRATATSVTQFVANSRAVAQRIGRAYGRDAIVVHPPVDTRFFTPGDGEGEGEYFLYVGRLVGYKRPELVCAAFAGLPYRLLVVGEGALGDSLRARASPNVTFLGKVERPELRRLYRGARALVFPAEEDFGIAMAEAQACGTPVVGLRAGGALDIVDEGSTGTLIDAPDIALLRDAVMATAGQQFDASEISARAQRFAPERFRLAMAEIVADVVARRGE